VIAEAALAECQAQGFHTAVAVIDRAGHLLVLLRDEQANPATIDMARDKAYTALVFRGPTLEFQKATAEDPSRAPQRDVPGILALGGGVPITVDGEIIGAVASSGSNQTMDDACAKAGIATADLLGPRRAPGCPTRLASFREQIVVAAMNATASNASETGQQATTDVAVIPGCGNAR
jgi:uncharacterized protein GlcG (DUF336 family)